MLILISIAVVAALFHNLSEIKTLREQLDAAGKTFSFREHIRRNWVAWVVSLLPIVILALSHAYIVAAYSGLEKLMFAVYAIVGWGGSDLAIKLLSSSQKRLTEVISEETSASKQ